MFEVSYSSVDEFGGLGTGAGCEVIGFDEEGFESSGGGIEQYSCAVAATSDDYEIVIGVVLELMNMLRSGFEMEGFLRGGFGEGFDLLAFVVVVGEGGGGGEEGEKEFMVHGLGEVIMGSKEIVYYGK